MLDFTALPAIDVHMHPWRGENLLSQDVEGFEDRTTMMGMCQLTSAQGGNLRDRIERFTNSTPFALRLRHSLAEILEVEPTRAAVAAARHERMRTDPRAYLSQLFGDANLESVLYDEGYPQPTMSEAEFAQECPIGIHRVARIEPWIDQLRDKAEDYDELVHLFDNRVQEALQDPALVALKSIIAYRTGLDVANPSLDQCRTAFTDWRRDNFTESRQYAKPIRDALLRRTFELTAETRTPIHIHSGGGDPDVKLAYARPTNLFDLISDFADHPIVLIHAGNPWIEDAAYLASILPEVYIDTSVMVPWHSLAIDQKMEVLLGVAPPAKIMYGSDEASEPEVLWLSAHIMRESLSRVLTKAVRDRWFDETAATEIARGVLADNTRELHNLR
jgi:predicted TIM-barrel fold metal-dependent hydrolase